MRGSLGDLVKFFSFSLTLLFYSLKYLLKMGSLTDWDEDDLNLEINGVVDQVIQERSGMVNPSLVVHSECLSEGASGKA